VTITLVTLLVLQLLVAGSAAVAAGQCPAKQLPNPSGKYAVGSVVLPVQRLHGTGTSRQVQLWYPAQPGTKGDRAHYVPDPQVVRALRSARFLDQADCVFDLWQSMLLPTMPNAPIASCHFPFVIRTGRLRLRHASSSAIFNMPSTMLRFPLTASPRHLFKHLDEPP